MLGRSDEELTLIPLFQDQRKQRYLHGSNNDCNLNYAPPSRHEWAAEDARALLAFRLDCVVEGVCFLVPVSEVVVGVPRAEEGDDEDEGAEDGEKQPDCESWEGMGARLVGGETQIQVQAMA